MFVAARAFSSCGSLLRSEGLAVGIRRLWSTGSVVVAHGLSRSATMWDPPQPVIEPGSPALEGGFLTTGPPGKPLTCVI